MNILADAEEAVALAVPQTRLVKPILYGVAALLAIGAAVLLWWLVIGRPRAAHVQAATAKVQAETAKATAGAAQDALRIVTVHGREIDHFETVTRENARAIQAAPGAGVALDPALDHAGRSALCMRSAYRADPGCAALRTDGGGVGAAPADGGGGAAD